MHQAINSELDCLRIFKGLLRGHRNSHGNHQKATCAQCPMVLKCMLFFWEGDVVRGSAYSTFDLPGIHVLSNISKVSDLLGVSAGIINSFRTNTCPSNKRTSRGCLCA